MLKVCISAGSAGPCWRTFYLKDLAWCLSCGLNGMEECVCHRREHTMSLADLPASILLMTVAHAVEAHAPKWQRGVAQGLSLSIRLCVVRIDGHVTYTVNSCRCVASQRCQCSGTRTRLICRARRRWTPCICLRCVMRGHSCSVCTQCLAQAAPARRFVEQTGLAAPNIIFCRPLLTARIGRK